MKYFFRRKIPQAQNVLVIESGATEVARRAVPEIRKIFPQARYHLCTCWPDPPAGMFTSVFRTAEYPSGWDKLRLLVSFRRGPRNCEVLVILSTGEPVMWWWKITAVALLSAKILVVNENADFFWLDWENRNTLRALVGIRWGVSQEELVSTALRALVFPLTLLFLVANAGFLYGRRWRRLALWKLSGLPTGNPQPNAGPVRQGTPPGVPSPPHNSRGFSP